MTQIAPSSGGDDPEKGDSSPGDFLGQQVQLELEARLSSLTMERLLTVAKQDLGENRYKYKTTGVAGKHLFDATETEDGSRRFINSRIVLTNERSEKLGELLSHPGLGNGAIRLVRKSTMLGEVVQREESFSGEQFSSPVVYIYASGTHPLFLVSRCGTRRKCKYSCTSYLPTPTEFQVEKVNGKGVIAKIHRETSYGVGKKDPPEGEKTEEQYIVTIYESAELSLTEKLLLVTSVIMLDFQLHKQTVVKTGKCVMFVATLWVVAVVAVIIFLVYIMFVRKSNNSKKP